MLWPKPSSSKEKVRIFFRPKQQILKTIQHDGDASCQKGISAYPTPARLQRTKIPSSLDRPDCAAARHSFAQEKILLIGSPSSLSGPAILKGRPLGECMILCESTPRA